MTLDLGRSVLELTGVGSRRQQQLAERGIEVVGDLLLHLPFRYEDRRRLTAVAEAVENGNPQTFRGRLQDVRLVLRRGRRFSLVRGTLHDDSGSLTVTWFNRPYLPGQVDEAADYLLHGEVRRRGDDLELLNPTCERLAAAVHTGRVVPVYPAIGAIGPALVRRLMTGAVEEHLVAGVVSEPVPERLLARHELPELGLALTRLHLPTGEDALDHLDGAVTGAHARLIYGELLTFQIRLQRARRRAAARIKSHRISIDSGLRRRLAALVPFELTAAQRRVIGEILADLESPGPMRRLLQGDVGSGKTVVAASALMATIDNGLQGAFMAPTALLAEQHHETLVALLGERCRVGLLTGSSADAPGTRDALESGALDLVVGTHALIQESVGFSKLGLAVIDEQHRFGVLQRQRLGGDGPRDLLVMTATPIPRSLTQTAYGDLDVSILDELPPGRLPVKTAVVSSERREEVLDHVGRELDDGGRVFFVYPAIRDTESGGAPSLEGVLPSLRRRFGETRVGAAHGGLPLAERRDVMASLQSGEVQLLAATTVIEVGVDVPEASMMVIEGAERFGLAQLHQLRGRVGRGARPSVCYAFHGGLTESGRRRLEVFAGTTDGFEIAERDLEIRGPGEVLGTRQAGLPRFRVADLRRDGRWMDRARDDALELCETLDETQLTALLARLEWRAPEGAA